MFLGRFFGNDEGKNQINRNVVGRLEIDWFIQPEKKAHGLLEVLQASMRDRKTVTEPGATEPFAIQQVAVDRGLGKMGSISYDICNQFQELFFAGDFSIDKNTLW